MIALHFFLLLMVSAWVKPFIMKQLSGIFSNHYDKINYTNNSDQKVKCPQDFGPIACTQVDINGFEWLQR